MKVLQDTRVFAISLRQGGLLMKNRLGVLFSLVWCVLFLMLPKSARATDPDHRYTDAVVLIQEAEDAEEKADYASAFPKYHDALNILHDIRTASPDWKANMVEFRVNDCESHLSQLKTKLASSPTTRSRPSRHPS